MTSARATRRRRHRRAAAAGGRPAVSRQARELADGIAELMIQCTPEFAPAPEVRLGLSLMLGENAERLVAECRRTGITREEVLDAHRALLTGGPWPPAWEV